VSILPKNTILGVTYAKKLKLMATKLPFFKYIVYEHFIFCELSAYLHYSHDQRPLTFWRDQARNEVDFIIGDEIGIEVKGTTLVQEKHLKGLNLFTKEIPLQYKFVVSLDQSPRKIGDVLILPWREFVNRLWAGEWRK